MIVIAGLRGEDGTAQRCRKEGAPLEAPLPDILAGLFVAAGTNEENVRRRIRVQNNTSSASPAPHQHDDAIRLGLCLSLN